MGRIKAEAIIDGIQKRTEEQASPGKAGDATSAVEQPATKKKSSRDGMHFIGFYANEEQKEALRTLAYETRRQNQDLMREALNLLLKKNGMKKIFYDEQS